MCNHSNESGFTPFNEELHYFGSRVFLAAVITASFALVLYLIITVGPKLRLI